MATATTRCHLGAWYPSSHAASSRTKKSTREGTVEGLTIDSEGQDGGNRQGRQGPPAPQEGGADPRRGGKDQHHEQPSTTQVVGQGRDADDDDGQVDEVAPGRFDHVAGVGTRTCSK